MYPSAFIQRCAQSTGQPNAWETSRVHCGNTSIRAQLVGKGIVIAADAMRPSEGNRDRFFEVLRSPTKRVWVMQCKLELRLLLAMDVAGSSCRAVGGIREGIEYFVESVALCVCV